MEISVNKNSFPDFYEAGMKSISYKDLLVKLFLFFLPFSQALTINIIFPLKFSEIFLFLLLLHECVSGNILKWRLSKPILLILIFSFLVFISVVINIFYKYNYSLSDEYARISPAIDSVLKFFYVLIAIIALIVTRNVLTENPKLIRWFFIGAIISSLYAWYLFVSGVLHLPTFLLPGMDADPQKINISIGDIIRCGTFKEGNYMGFFLLISAIVAIYNKKSLLAVFFFATILTTFSTTSIFCSIIFLMFYLMKRYKKYKGKLIAGICATAFLIMLLVQFSDAFRTIFYNKLFANEDSVENANDLYSKADRLNTTMVGLNIFVNNPVLGIGLANYGLHYNHYNELPELDLVDETKRIPNDIYVEILSECGSLSFIVFLVFLYNL